MRDVCGAVISFRGIVVLDWEKETGSEITKDGWVIVGKVSLGISQNILGFNAD